MTIRRRLSFLAATVAAALTAMPALAHTPPAGADVLWSAWRDRFVDVDGRVMDNANGYISHSEGQGYGLLLAWLADDRASFERIWSFTRTQLLVRDDGLAAWRWEPNASPHITDVNNATDGDVLIAYSLAQAGWDWGDDDLVEAAANIAQAIGTETLTVQRDRTVMLPGVAGFTEEDRRDGPVVNLSYWVFEAFPTLAQLAPDTDWDALAEGGLDVLTELLQDPAHLPPDWVSLASSRAQPANGFDRVFGYNAIRIPLYLARAGYLDPALVDPFLASRDATGSSAVTLTDSGQRLEPLSDAGYRMALAAADCAVHGTPVPADLKVFSADLYYPSTLYLLAWFFLAEDHPGCL